MKLPDSYEALAGQTDATMTTRTGRTWSEWIGFLDERGCESMEHKEIARLVKDEIQLGWWSQCVAVGYERLKGKREVGQSCTGDWAASKSKTFNVSADTVFDALENAELRKLWLEEEVDVRTATRPKSIRYTLPDGTIASAWITEKGPEKCGVGIQHEKLSGPDEVATMKVFWGERLVKLQELLKDLE